MKVLEKKDMRGRFIMHTWAEPIFQTNQVVHTLHISVCHMVVVTDIPDMVENALVQGLLQEEVPEKEDVH